MLMKLLTIILTIVLLLFIVQIVMAISIGKTEQQKYAVIQKDGKFEVRKYPAAILASVKLSGSYDDVSTRGFKTLANYIFGGNNEEMKIKMTAPVRMELGDTTTMSFVMPSQYAMEDLPQPKSGNIQLIRSGEVTTASLKFGGYANDKRIQRKIENLKSILDEKGIEHCGDFQFLGYNPPFQVIGRRNEVMVTINKGYYTNDNKQD